MDRDTFIIEVKDWFYQACFEGNEKHRELVLLRTYQLYGLMGLISYVRTKITSIRGMVPLETKIPRDLNVSSHNVDTIR